MDGWRLHLPTCQHTPEARYSLLTMRLQLLRLLAMFQVWNSCAGCSSAHIESCNINLGVSSDADQLQRSILLAFKRGITEDALGALANWGQPPSLPICKWNGVSCAQAPGDETNRSRVIALNLPSYGLEGNFSSSLFTLPYLTHLHLANNRLGGILNFGNATGNLVSLDLSSNRLSGGLPASIGNLGRSLETLRLHDNPDFITRIPVAIGLCNRLARLDMGSSQSWENPTHMSLYHYDNSVNGSIPDSLANCSSLMELRLTGARLVGRIPSWLGTLKRLQLLNLSDNFLTGPIPASLGNLTGLTILALLDNAGLEGHIPSELSSCPCLAVLAVGMTRPELTGRNQINGPFPIFLANTSSVLEELDLVGTQMNGSIPEEIGLLGFLLRSLDLSANYWSGEIPATIGNLTRLTFLDLSFNDFRGAIPRELGFQCKNLEVLSMGRSSDLGVAFRDVVNVNTRLTHGSYLSNVLMTGSIPAELGHLQSLTSLDIGYLSVGGKLPSFNNATSLQDLWVSYTLLSGSVPEGNQLPRSLRVLELRCNKLTGPIPVTLGNLTHLTFLDVSYNDLEGTIPNEISSLRNLDHLGIGGSSLGENIGRSNITGSIPYKLGQLGQLSSLQLSSTQLTGEMPQSLGNLSALTSLMLNNNYPSELYPRQLQT